MKNSADLGGCYPPRPSASVDNTLLDLQNSSYPTRPHSIIAKSLQDTISQYAWYKASGFIIAAFWCTDNSSKITCALFTEQSSVACDKGKWCIISTQHYNERNKNKLYNAIVIVNTFSYIVFSFNSHPRCKNFRAVSLKERAYWLVQSLTFQVLGIFHIWSLWQSRSL